MGDARSSAIGFAVGAAIAITGLTGQTPPPPSVIPPIVLQGCGEIVKAKGRFSGGLVGALSGSSASASQSFDISFVNTTTRVAKIVIIAPGSVVGWRIAATSGECSVRAVRFADGSEWSAPIMQPSASPTST